MSLQCNLIKLEIFKIYVPLLIYLTSLSLHYPISSKNPIQVILIVADTASDLHFGQWHRWMLMLTAEEDEDAAAAVISHPDRIMYSNWIATVISECPIDRSGGGRWWAEVSVLCVWFSVPCYHQSASQSSVQRMASLGLNGSARRYYCNYCVNPPGAQLRSAINS